MVIKCFFNAMKNPNLIAVKLQAHLVDLLDTNAVLASDGAAFFNAERQDFTAKASARVS